jgi:hypothetical protein
MRTMATNTLRQLRAPEFTAAQQLPMLAGAIDGPALSTDETVRYHQLASLMSDSRGRFAVAYDVDIFTPQYAPRFEVNYLAVRVNGACQHATIAVACLNKQIFKYFARIALRHLIGYSGVAN